VSAKKPPAKIKDKTSHRAETAATTKRKPAIEAKEPVQVMDARSHKDRRQDDRRQKELPVVAERRTTERRVKVTRRRQIDPTTCERDYSVEEVEFMSALDDYKRSSGRMFPTCSEILEVFRALGYQRPVKLSEATSAAGDVTVVTSEQAV
jgi:hypothetical protein